MAQLHEVLDHDGVPVLVMELLEGETLQERLAHRTPTVREALKLAVQIAAALERLGPPAGRPLDRLCLLTVGGGGDLGPAPSGARADLAGVPGRRPRARVVA